MITHNYLILLTLMVNYATRNFLGETGKPSGLTQHELDGLSFLSPGDVALFFVV
jgi:hypothetical protein